MTLEAARGFSAASIRRVIVFAKFAGGREQCRVERTQRLAVLQGKQGDEKDEGEEVLRFLGKTVAVGKVSE